MTQRKTKYKDKEGSFAQRLLDSSQSRARIALLLDRIEDYRNLGSMFRIADAANLEHIYGYQMAALFEHRKLGKVARSTERFVPYSNLSTPGEIAALCAQYELIALELTDQSIPYTRYQPTKPCILIVGNETRGVSKELLSLTTGSIHIPMYGINHSMNVAVATGIAAYHLRHALTKAG